VKTAISLPATVDRRALVERIGALPDWLMGKIDAGLARALALTRS